MNIRHEKWSLLENGNARQSAVCQLQNCKMALDRAINILPYCIKMELIDKIGMQLCENISALPCVRSISGRSMSIWW